ncbi:MAG TPA: DUF3574 domain-containing protein [Methylocella sp.]|nr:DUF3574 domain-containing protein [Methylocella sp.]
MRYTAVSGAIMLAAGLLIAPYFWTPSALMGGGLTCRAASKPMERLELLFGSGRKNINPVSDDDWAAFVAAEITPRFPDGLTMLTGYGQWRDTAGSLVKETSRLLLIWYAPAADAETRIEEIRAAYRARFGQDSVLRADGPQACVSF